MPAEAKYQGVYPGLVTKIIASYVAHHNLAPEQIPDLIGAVHRTIAGLGKPVEPQGALVPAVPIRRSIAPDLLVCLEDGRKMKMLKRHLMSTYGMTPDQYRAKWGLPPDYPMVAPNYSAQRSALAKQLGLGRGGRQAAPPAASDAPRPRRGRPRGSRNARAG